jgi:hypothetical protein
MGFSPSDQDVRFVGQLLAPLDEKLRSVAYLLSPQPYFGWQPHAAVQVDAHIHGKVAATTRAQIRPASEPIRSELAQREADAAGQALRDGMIRAVHRKYRALFGGQRVRSYAVEMHQMPARAALDDVSDRDRPRALRTVHLHNAPRAHSPR